MRWPPTSSRRSSPISETSWPPGQSTVRVFVPTARSTASCSTSPAASMRSAFHTRSGRLGLDLGDEHDQLRRAGTVGHVHMCDRVRQRTETPFRLTNGVTAYAAGMAQAPTIAPAEGRLGVLTVGLGAVATTLIAGTEL